MFRFAPKCAIPRLGRYSMMSATAVRFNSSTTQPKPSKPASDTNGPKPDGEKGTASLPFCL